MAWERVLLNPRANGIDTKVAILNDMENLQKNVEIHQPRVYIPELSSGNGFRCTKKKVEKL